jgi:hypothetical protein
MPDAMTSWSDSTDEGFEDAAATFPRRAVVSVTDAPLMTPEFAEAL